MPSKSSKKPTSSVDKPTSSKEKSSSSAGKLSVSAKSSSSSTKTTPSLSEKQSSSAGLSSMSSNTHISSNDVLSSSTNVPTSSTKKPSSSIEEKLSLVGGQSSSEGSPTSLSKKQSSSNNVPSTSTNVAASSFKMPSNLESPENRGKKTEKPKAEDPKKYDIKFKEGEQIALLFKYDFRLYNAKITGIDSNWDDFPHYKVHYNTYDNSYDEQVHMSEQDWRMFHGTVENYSHEHGLPLRVPKEIPTDVLERRRAEIAASKLGKKGNLATQESKKDVPKDGTSNKTKKKQLGANTVTSGKPIIRIANRKATSEEELYWYPDQLTERDEVASKDVPSTSGPPPKKVVRKLADEPSTSGPPPKKATRNVSKTGAMEDLKISPQKKGTKKQKPSTTEQLQKQMAKAEEEEMDVRAETEAAMYRT